MNTSVIRHRVADFLKQYPPFDSIPAHELLEIAGSGRVKFHQAQEYVLRQGQEKTPLVWIVQQGRVDLIEDTMAGEQLRDVVGEGDLLGLDRFLGGGRSLYSARTAGDVILYGVNADLFESLVQRYPAVKRYIRAHFSVSSLAGSRRASWLDAEAPPEDFLRARLVALPVHVSRAEARSRLNGAGNRVVALVGESARPFGVMTAADLSTESNEPVRLAARPWSAAIAAPITTRAAVRALMNARTDALAVTADGTLDSALQGILTAEELALFSGHDPIRLIGAIRNAASPAEVRPLLRQAKRLILDALADPNDVDDCARIGAEVEAAMAEACLTQAQNQVLAAGAARPAASLCWFQFAAAERRDVLNTCFPHVAAVYDERAAIPGPHSKDYFDAVARAALAWVKECGLAMPGGEWALSCKSVSEWKQLYVETIRDPLACNLYERRGLFDASPLAGDASLLNDVQKEARLQLRDDSVVIPLLANDTLANLPPLTFFRGLVVDLDGAQRDSVDLDKTAISPIADAARVFAIARGRLDSVDTLDRLRNAALDFPDGAAIFSDSAEAFRIAHYYRWVTDCPTIAPLQLSKFDQRLLKTAFSSIQRLLEFVTSTFLPGA